MASTSIQAVLALLASFGAVAAATLLNSASSKASLAFAPSTFLSKANARSWVESSASNRQSVHGLQALSMSCRRNLKKEKRERNEQMARQYRKSESKFPMVGKRRDASASSADSEWLSQIFGQHTIFRRDHAMLSERKHEAQVGQMPRAREAVHA